MRFLIIFIGVIGFSCQPTSTVDVAKEKYFDLANFTQLLLENQVSSNTPVTKSTKVNAVEEDRTIDCLILP